MVNLTLCLKLNYTKNTFLENIYIRLYIININYKKELKKKLMSGSRNNQKEFKMEVEIHKEGYFELDK